MPVQAKIAASIINDISQTTIGLTHICAKYGISKSLWLDWVKKDSALADQYARAKEEQIEAMAEEILDIADDGSNDLMTIVKGSETYEQENKEVVNRSRLRVDSRKWLLSKLAPKKYGDKIDITSGGETLPSTINIILDNGGSKCEAV